jgi:beta-glucuronidase
MKKRVVLALLVVFSCQSSSFSQTAMINVSGRKTISLNGEWPVIIDPTGTGEWRQVWTERKPKAKTEFVEYSFDGGPTLRVPADFNTQRSDLFYVEGVVWYKRSFVYRTKPAERVFVHFGAVNYFADVYLNGKHIGTHEGGFTPFQFELTAEIKDGDNTLIVKANSARKKDGLPGMGYDWFNYGGITRDVHLITTNQTFIEDYFIQLSKGSMKDVAGWIKLNGNKGTQEVHVKIPELKINYKTVTNQEGVALVKFMSKFSYWSPENPKLYNVVIETASDTISDQIGFRNIEVKGTKVFLNGKPIFFKGINIHEERPLGGGKANTEADATTLLTWAKDVGCNLVRLAHYPHSEYMVKLAEKMGLMVWDELPAYQHIEFSAPGMPEKLDLMRREMMRRDRNRCGVVIWSLSNETYSFTKNRDIALIELAKKCKLEDSTRLMTSVINTQGYNNHTFNVTDTLYKHFDIMSINEYLGWYVPWQGKPIETKWKLVCEKPIIISEFGGESKFGSNYGPKDEAAYWSEEYQEQIYKDQIDMFSTTPNLTGVCPWLLVDYRSSGRMHPVYQNGYNRKGLLSEFGDRKKAWYFVEEILFNKVAANSTSQFPFTTNTKSLPS